MNLWLYLVDDELRLDELRGSGYDLYIKDAGRLADSTHETTQETKKNRNKVQSSLNILRTLAALGFPALCTRTT